MEKQKPTKENTNGMEPLQARDDALFEALGKSKKKKKHKILRTVLIVLVVVAVTLVIGVASLQRRVREQFAATGTEVLSHTVETGTISTVVSGSGILTNVDTETVELPSGVELTEVLVSYGDTVEAGDLLATVDMASVRTAMSELQTQIDDLDEQIMDAEDDTVSTYLKAGVPGRVKILYAQEGDKIADVMVEHGAVAVLSLDGYMAVDIETDALSRGDTVTVLLSGGDTVEGSVESAAGGKVTILVTDNGPAYDEEVSVVTEEGTQLGSGKLYIHNPLAVTGYAGTVSRVSVQENTKAYASTTICTLTDTGFSANYDSLLRTRSEAEETLLELLNIQRCGGVPAPISGSIFSAADLDSDEEISEVAVISPDVSMSVTISVDESDILSLEIDQEADVTVSSVSEDVLTGCVTEIDKTASDGSYTAVITLDKISGMLPGMTADIDVKIQGVEDAILIPVDALHKTSSGAYVYTSYDEQTETYGDPVDVIVGLSNDDYVEIKSGLQVGDVVYYTESTSFMDFFGGMGNIRGEMSGNQGGMPGGMEMPSGGNMPSGGGMPSGGFPGGRGQD